MDQHPDPDYRSLEQVLQMALEQASRGKGRERHANGQPFEEQRMQTISDLLRSSRGMAFQTIKKVTEALDMEEPERRIHELLGAIVYIAGIVVREQRDLQEE